MTCSVDGCEGPESVRGLCQKHYTRWLRHGDPATVKDWTRRTISRLRSGTSYVMIRIEGGYKAEHVLMAEKALGRPLPKAAVVHHVDRDGTNNNTRSPWNLVVCPDQKYHMLLHARARALGYEPLRAGDKLTADVVAAIKSSQEPRAVLARRHAVSIHTIKAVRAGKRDEPCQASGREFIGGDLAS